MPANDVRLRDVTAEDLPVLFEQQLDPEAARMAEFPSRDREAFFAHWAKVLADRDAVNKTILFEGRVAGNVTCFRQGGLRKVGYWIGKSYWGRGIATRALTELLSIVRERPLFAHVARHNVGSIRVLEKCGFRVRAVEVGAPGVDGTPVEEFLMEVP